MKKNIEEFCRYYYASTFIPTTYYNSNTLQMSFYPATIESLHLFDYITKIIKEFTKNPTYLITKSFGYFGIVKLRNQYEFFIIGPLFSTPVTTEALKDFMHEFGISIEYQQAVAQFFQSSPLVSFNQFLNSLAFLHFSLNNESLEIARHFEITDTYSHQNISIQHSNRVYDAKEDQSFHNTYYFERHYLDYVKNGETEKIKSFLVDNGTSLKEGTIGSNALRQAKNIFISCATLSTRSAIIGGLDIEQAYHLSDIYINESEKMQSVDQIWNLQYTMIIDFTERVSKTKISPNMSKEVFECIQFITGHTNEPIRVNDVSIYIDRSRSYISKKFKAEIGIDLGIYIMHCKLEEAKSLLTFSDKSLSEISSYLCFSSQAYFQNVFKRKYGLTPKQYRNQTIK